jgi:delta-lactam-biosynthetic de-N-acetylase
MRKKVLAMSMVLVLLGGNICGCNSDAGGANKQSESVSEGALNSEIAETETGIAEVTETQETETEEETSVLGKILVNEQIADVDSLDTELHDWGLGKSKDDEGRPIDAVNAQEKYGVYNALFLGDEENTIYLTFDEGYEYGMTESILDTLKEKDVKAVFFVTEYYAKTQPELVQRIIDEGHVLGNHSATHPSDGLTSLSLEDQENEVMETHNYVLDQFGYNMYLFRYPTGRFNEQSLAVVSNCNYKSVFWSFAYLDYDVNNQPDPAESLEKIEGKLHPQGIYLLHAESETNATILGDLIDYAREQGYSFGTL